MKIPKLLNKIIDVIVPFVYIAGGITIIVFGLITNEFNNELLGALLIGASTCRLIKFFAGKKFFDFHTIDLSMSLISFALGFVFLFGELTIEIICLVWGLIEILNGAIEISADLMQTKTNKLAWLSIIISIGEIVFGTLLCIHSNEGILAHLIFMGITYMLTGALVIVELIESQKKKQK